MSNNVSGRLRQFHEGKGWVLKRFSVIKQAQNENQVLPGRDINAKAQRIKRKRQIFWRGCLYNQEVEQERIKPGNLIKFLYFKPIRRLPLASVTVRIERWKSIIPTLEDVKELTVQVDIRLSRTFQAMPHTGLSLSFILSINFWELTIS